MLFDIMASKGLSQVHNGVTTWALLIEAQENGVRLRSINIGVLGVARTRTLWATKTACRFTLHDRLCSNGRMIKYDVPLSNFANQNEELQK